MKRKTTKGKQKNSFSSWPISRINVKIETRFLLTNELLSFILLILLFSFFFIFCTIPLVVLAKHGCKCNNKDCEQNEHSGKRRFLTSPMELLGNERNSMQLLLFQFVTIYFIEKQFLLDEVKLCRQLETTTHWQQSKSPRL